MPAATKLHQFDDTNRRAGERTPVGHPSTIRSAGGTAVEVAVEDLSRLGFMYRSTDRFEIGAVLQVGLAGSGTAQATVVRRDGDRYGCAFIQPLSPATLAAAFTNGTVLQGAFGEAEPLPWAAPVANKYSRQVRALIWMVGASAPWLLVAAVRFG